jgi:hypothetical protein
VEVAYELERLSKAFYTTGNIAVGKQLAMFATEIQTDAESIRKEDYKIAADRLRDVEQYTFNVINACLHAPEIAQLGELPSPPTPPPTRKV